jgi:hypothetical protein
MGFPGYKRVLFRGFRGSGRESLCIDKPAAGELVPHLFPGFSQGYGLTQSAKFGKIAECFYANRLVNAVQAEWFKSDCPDQGLNLVLCTGIVRRIKHDGSFGLLKGFAG